MNGRPRYEIASVAGASRLPACWRPPPGGDPVAGAEPRSPDAERAETKRVARAEAALWSADEALTARRLARVAGLEGAAEARELLGELRRRLRTRRSALEVVEVAGGFRLMTRAVYAPWIERLRPTDGRARGAPRLSHAAAETLAIVAYRQPVVRAEVESIRGVGCGDVLRQLLEADLLRIVGRSEELGRPLLYGTTGRFLELYGLASLDDLPDRDEGADGAGPTTDNAATGGAA